MEYNNENLLELLDYIDPALLDYTDWTGIGMALAADKIVGCRAANIINVQFAELCRQHNDANIITLSGRFVELDVNKQIVDTFLTTKFEGGRHAMRVKKIMDLDADVNTYR